MRVFDKEIAHYTSCPFWQTEDDRCDYNGKCILDKLQDCPFSKSLTLSDIESCGFELIDRARHPGFSDILFGKDLVFNKTILSDTVIQLIKYNKDNVLHISIKNSGTTMFVGVVMNLPEFKLVLKMLNIE